MRERLTILVIVGTRTDEHSLRSQVGIGSDDVAMHAAMLQVQISRLGPNLQNILRQSYDFLTIMPMLRST